MKDNLRIDHLLNSYIDGVLTLREQTELKRLIAHNPKISERLNELQRCKMLISSLPVAQAPADTLARVKAKLQPEVPVAVEEPVSEARVGAVHLIFRKVLAAAAMVVLISALVFIVYSIVAPPKNIDTVVAAKVGDNTAIGEQESVPEQQTRQVSSADTASVLEKPVKVFDVMDVAAANKFTASLELKTDKLLATDIAIKKVLENNGFENFVTSSSRADEYIYTVDCEAGRLDSVLAGLEDVWDKFTASMLVLESNQAEQPVMIEKVMPWQIAEVASQFEPERRLRAAQYYAIMNNSVQEILPRERPIFYILDVNKPKPVLTRDEHASDQPGKSQLKGHLTIILKGQ